LYKDISVDELAEYKNAVYIDVRSEDEFQEGTIPGSINIPLFDNGERARVGTIYTRESPKKAREIGLEIASGKLPDIYRQVEAIADKDPVIIFCWRGGMRSRSLATILDLMGLNVYRLSGGYKSYRKLIVKFFETKLPFEVIVLKGNTGTGKTELLNRFKAEGYPVIDLEGLSNNRGSVFGDIGMGIQPKQKQFESLLYNEIAGCRDCSYILIECESRRIGRLTVPETLFSAMQEGKQILVYDSLENRSDRLAREYTLASEVRDDDLKKALEKLKKRLGNSTIEELLTLLEIKDYRGFAGKLIVEYYDSLYGYPNDKTNNYDLCLSNRSVLDCMGELKYFLNKNYG